jgi:hypothetical protein
MKIIGTFKNADGSHVTLGENYDGKIVFADSDGNLQAYDRGSNEVKELIAKMQMIPPTE